MADPILNMTEIADSLSQSILDSISPLVTIFKLVGIALLVYIIFLILKAVFRWKTMTKVSQMAKNVEDINKKMDVLIAALGKLERKEEKAEIKEQKKSFFQRIFGKSEDKEESDKEDKIQEEKNKKRKKEKSKKEKPNL